MAVCAPLSSHGSGSRELTIDGSPAKVDIGKEDVTTALLPSFRKGEGQAFAQLTKYAVDFVMGSLQLVADP
mgnify:CR=1 FL=1